MNKKQHKLILALGAIISIGLCIGAAFAVLGSGITLWFALDKTSELPTPTRRPTRRPVPTHTATPIASSPSPSTATATIPPTETLTPTPPPTVTPPPTSTPVPPTLTPIPPTATPPPTESPPPATLTPTATPLPTFPFVVLETAQFPTNHLDFDVFIAITDADNKPLAGYRVLGRHSSGLQLDSEISAHDWTVNSGAMHYKGGNLKYTMLNSPGGVWSLQLVDEAGNPAAPPVECPFEFSNPTWYFILYRLDQ